MKVITTEEGLTVHWHNKNYAVVRTYGLFTGDLYQIYKRTGDKTWERQPKIGIELFHTIKGAREHIRKLEGQN